MFRNFLTIAVRNMLKHRFFAAINLSGLVIGVTCCLLVFIYVKDELSYDRFHRDADLIYRVGLHGKIAGQEIFTSNSSAPLGEAMQNEIPGIASTVRILPLTRGNGNGIAFRNGEIIFSESMVHYADSNFFQFFSFELLEGDAKTALNEPSSVVITKALAEKYFNGDALGKTLIIGSDQNSFKVTGVVKEAPEQSHVKFNALLSFTTLTRNPDQFYNGWTGNSMYTYVKKDEKTKVESVNAKLEELVAKYVGAELEQGLGVKFDEFRKQGGIYAYYIYPLTDSHLRSNFADDIEPGSDIRYIYIFAGVGIFILILACINFMNLSTAQSAGRAKEVGLRKTLGSQRSQMIGQFLAESLVYGFLAIVLSILACYVLLPFFNNLAGKNLQFISLFDPYFYVAAIALWFSIGIFAGSYPAFYLTSFEVVEVLKGKVRSGMKTKGIRSSLVVFQFAISVFLMIATVVVFQQLQHMQDKNLGLDKGNVIIIRNTQALNDSRASFKNEINGLAGVKASSYTNNVFPGVNNTTVFREVGNDKDYLSGTYRADYDHLQVLKMNLLAGRFLSQDFAVDTASCIMNEAAVKEFGWEDAIGKQILDFNGDQPKTLTVVGVVQDFNFESLKTKVRPIIIQLTRQSSNLLIKYEGNPTDLVQIVDEKWKKLAPTSPFEYSFLDQNFETLFRAEVKLRSLFSVFSGLAIAIACLGLFALAAFTTEQRTKEIGIRKALGASVSNLSLLLSKEFVLLVLIAIVPACIGAYFVANWWLSDFPYRITLSPVMFLVVSVVAIAIGWLTVSYQAIKAAISKPVNSLRQE
jgi:putative ABC transport system permease protein